MCRCKASPETVACAKRLASQAPLREMERAERAAMCRACVGWRGIVRDSWRSGFEPVTCGGVRVELRVHTGSCQRGLHPDAKGRTRWLGVRWRGVPLPARGWMWLWSGRSPRDYRGCGCVDGLKRITEWIGARVSGVLGRAGR